jgi:hypothetical protein
MEEYTLENIDYNQKIESLEDIENENIKVSIINLIFIGNMEKSLIKKI